MITWHYDETVERPATVDIELRDSVTNEPLQTIVNGVNNFGYYFWNVDTRLLPSDNVMLFIGKVLAPRSCAQIYSHRFAIAKRQSGCERSASWMTRQQQRQKTNVRGPNGGGRCNEPPTWSMSAESINSTNTASRTAALTALQDAALENSFSQMSLDDGDATTQRMIANDKNSHEESSGEAPDSSREIEDSDDAQDSDDSLQMAHRGQLRRRSTKEVVGKAVPQRKAPTVAVVQKAVAEKVTWGKRVHRGGRPRKSDAQSSSALLNSGSHSHSAGLRSTTIVDDPVIWSAHPDFIYWAVYMDATTIRRCLRQVVKTDGMTARTPLENNHTAGMFCVRYLLLLYYKEKIAPDVRKAIEANVYIPHPTLVAAWHLSAMYRQQNLIGHAQELQQTASLSSPTTRAHIEPTESEQSQRREQVVHKTTVAAVPRRVTRAISRVQPSLPAKKTPAHTNSALPLHRLRQPNIRQSAH